MTRAKRASEATAIARSNIAFAKYWGKSDLSLNLPAVPSISMTLDRLVTTTSVLFRDGLAADQIHLDGQRMRGSAHDRAVELLDRVRERGNTAARAEVHSNNSFPTAAGLASSASGFAALAAAATAALGLRVGPKTISRIARQSSASAARSVFGGFAELPAGRPGDASLTARQLHGPEHWDVCLVVALTARGPKKVGSTEGMERSRRTSPHYQSWVECAPAMTRQVRSGLRHRDIDRLGAAMEQSTLAFHACAMAAAPGIIYFQPATLAALATVRDLRERRGIPVYATMDAGPHVKALCPSEYARKVQAALRRTDGVLSTLIARPGPGVEIC